MVSGVNPVNYWYPPPMAYYPPPPGYYQENQQAAYPYYPPPQSTPPNSQPSAQNSANPQNQQAWYPPAYMWYYPPPWAAYGQAGYPPPPSPQTPTTGEPTVPTTTTTPQTPTTGEPTVPTTTTPQTPTTGEPTVPMTTNSQTPTTGEPTVPTTTNSQNTTGASEQVNIAPNINIPNPETQTPTSFQPVQTNGNGYDIQSNNLADIDYRNVGGNPYVEFSNGVGRFTTTMDHLFHAVDLFGKDFNLTQGIGFDGKPKTPLAKMYDSILSKLGDSPFSNKARVNVNEELLGQPIYRPEGGAYGMGKTYNPFDHQLLTGFSNVGDINQNILYPQRAQIGTMSRNFMFGTDNMDLMDGSGGSDIIRPGAGNDIVNVHTGDYVLEEYSASNDIFFLNIDKNSPHSTTRIFGGGGDDALIVKLSDVEPGDLFSSQDEIGNLYTALEIEGQHYSFYDIEHILFTDANGDVAFTLDV